MPAALDRTHLDRIDLTHRILQRECARCATDIHPEWQLCAHCDTRLATECPACGVPLPPAGATHCGHCGLTFRPTPTA